MRIVIVIGTRPEAIKMAPVYRALSELGIEPILVSSGQHLDLLRATLVPLELTPHEELEIMTVDQLPNRIAARILGRLPQVIEGVRAAAVLVQGDTTTALATALAAYHLAIPVGHVEAGLRTYDEQSPFPEEGNRQMIARIAKWSFAPTELAKQNLLDERVDPSRIHVTGNTAVDGMMWIMRRISNAAPRDPYALMTLHRRESFGEPLHEILDGVLDFLKAEPDARVLWPVHPNPQVRALAARLDAHPHVELCEPLPYDEFVRALARSRMVLSDSGGVQEEAPSLGKRVLVARETTERPEAVHAGLNRVVGRDRTRIRDELIDAWHQPPYDGPLPAPNPYGDGSAGRRIAAIVARDLRSSG